MTALDWAAVLVGSSALGAFAAVFAIIWGDLKPRSAIARLSSKRLVEGMLIMAFCLALAELWLVVDAPRPCDYERHDVASLINCPARAP